MLRTGMRVTCKHCGGPHPAFECRKKSTGEAQKVERRSPKPKAAGSSPATRANSVMAKSATTAGSSNGRTAEFDSANAGSTPAPASKFDKKAYMKTYMKTYMARYREDVKSGKRAPKKKVKAS